ncbi:MAG: AraC family transcriptional regulator [Pyrinomonadaceae bacterium]
MADQSKKNEGDDPRSVKVNALKADLSRTHILYGLTDRHSARWAGHLSLKTFTGGRAFYDAGAGHYAVDDDSCLILNELQPYRITIDSETKMESFCIFFETGLAEEVHRSLTEKPDRLLDDPGKPLAERIDFIQKLYSRLPLEGLLSEVRSVIRRKTFEQILLKENLYRLMEGLLLAREETLREIGRLPARRASTREELYRRVCRARDFIAASWNRSVSLEEMARIACLSPNHFLRSFKEVFGRTPHQYLTALRLREAEKLLRRTDLPVISICQSVGFESHASFSLLFRRHFGLSPDRYRRRKR